MPAPNGSNADPYDVAIIGAGVVGCAIARRFTLEGARVALIEKAADILDGASKANSAILHTAFDAPTDSLEHACIRDGYREYMDIHRQLGLPLERCGAHVVAWNEEEVAGLEGILHQAHDSGIEDVQIIDASVLRDREPSLSTTALAAISVPGECIIDPWSAPYVYLTQALENGAEVFCGHEVKSGQFDGETWQLETSKAHINCRSVINCAGLYGDRIDQNLLGASGFTITPRKGQFVVYDKAASGLIESVILPVPSARTKGIVVFRTVFGNLVVGPTAEDQQSRHDASTDKETLRMLMKSGETKLPDLKQIPVTAVYAGLRPASEFKDYQIENHTDKNWITVGGIRSTGLSSALGIAHYVYEKYAESGNKHACIKSPLIPQANRLAERASRDWESEQAGEIVCHCELVTRREVQQALSGPLGAKSLQGLKRQTRVTMGRCQGFYCSARLAELTADQFDLPLSEGINDE